MSDGYFAQIETSFILHDSRLDDLTNIQRWIYITLWCYAVDCHKSTVKMPHLCKTIARLSRNDARTVPLALAKLQELCLIKIVDENCITICGVEAKHPKLRWKEITGEPKVKVAQGHRVEKKRIEKKRIEKNREELSVQKTDPNHSLFIKYYCSEYEKVFGIKYVFGGGKDAKAVKTLLETYGYDVLCQMVPVFFADTAEFVKGHALTKFLFQARAVREEMAKPKEVNEWWK